MIYMSKLFNITSKITLAILSFFFFNLTVSAANVKAHVYECSSGHDLYTTTYKLDDVSGDRKIGCVGVISVDNKTHAYCIEPGVKMQSGYDNGGEPFTKYSQNFFKDSKKAADKRTKVQQILSFAKKVNDFSKDTKEEDRYKVYAAQGLIWEVIVGERNNFKTNDPNPSDSGDFYSVIHSSANASKTGITAIKNEYDAILAKIRATYEVDVLGDKENIFSFSKTSAKEVPLTCNATTCSLTINDVDFKHWRIKSKDGLKVEKNDAGNAITISTPVTNAIDRNKSKIIELEAGGNTGTAWAYSDDDRQDVVTVVGTTQSAYLKVYTPKYKVKIKKVSSSKNVTQLNNINLSGAKFNICKDSSCKTIINDEPLQTNKNGEATYAMLETPGKYYIKEISAPVGYEADSTPIEVTVDSRNVSDSGVYKEIIVPNRPKETKLIKYTYDDETKKSTILDDGCGTNNYIGPEFEVLENGKSLYFSEISPGVYVYSNKETTGATTKLKTCKGRFSVYTLPNCKYTIAETKAPEGLALDPNPTQDVNVCSSKGEIKFTNGFSGLEFQKKDEDGNLIAGGKFSLQMKVNNVYKDILLKEVSRGYYEYQKDIKETDEGATYIFLTTNDEESKDYGRAFIEKLPPGEYRVVEKEAPEGYEFISDKDSTAKVTIKDSSKEGKYLVELINQKVNKKGSEDSAELIVTITTGRKVPNYVVIISILTGLLIAAIILRKKFKK